MRTSSITTCGRAAGRRSISEAASEHSSTTSMPSVSSARAIAWRSRTESSAIATRSAGPSSASQPTSQTATGSGSPFSAIGASGSSRWMPDEPTSSRTISAARICAPAAAAHSRLASMTGTPK